MPLRMTCCSAWNSVPASGWPHLPQGRDKTRDPSSIPQVRLISQLREHEEYNFLTRRLQGLTFRLIGALVLVLV